MAFRSNPFGGGGGRPSRSKLLRGKLPTNPNEHRINEQIRVPKVRLISDTGEQVGIVDTREALRMAKEKNLDLMEVASGASPPVCKIADYGKFKYEKKKKDHAAKKKQVVIKVKEIQIRPNTDEHDKDFKIKNVRKFLEEGDKVKITMLFRGREIVHNQVGMTLLKDIAKEVEEVGVIEFYPKLEGRKMIMIVAPSKKAVETAKKKVIEKEKAAAKEKKLEAANTRDADVKKPAAKAKPVESEISEKNTASSALKTLKVATEK